MIKAIKRVSTDVLIGTRASFNILIAKYQNKNVTTIAMEHMNFNAHDQKFQNQIINAYRDVNKVTTLTTADQAIYQSKLKTPVYVVPNIANNTGAFVKCPRVTNVESFFTIIPELCKPTKVINNPIPAETAIFI